MSQRALPRHIGIIMDGNGRWARSRGQDRVQGHREGAESVRAVVRAARELGVSALTLFAFSEQNWDRPPEEVNALMELLHTYVVEERDEIMQNGVRLVTIGRIERIPAFVRGPLVELVRDSEGNGGMILCLALSYGGREDIVQAARALAAQAARGEIDAGEINDVVFEARLSTALLPPLDLMIRTSGELRISNFLLWQAAYSELYFTDVMWPDFRRPELVEAIEAYAGRERRFGLTSSQLDQKA
jgi:undecaprenyl diphosphate synthase